VHVRRRKRIGGSPAAVPLVVVVCSERGGLEEPRLAELGTYLLAGGRLVVEGSPPDAEAAVVRDGEEILRHARSLCGTPAGEARNRPAGRWRVIDAAHPALAGLVPEGLALPTILALDPRDGECDENVLLAPAGLFTVIGSGAAGVRSPAARVAAAVYVWASSR
jgi:hypothetical protein